MYGNCYCVTYKKIHKWFDKCFQKYGWLLLARERNDSQLIDHHRLSACRLRSAISQYLSQTDDNDKKRDLECMAKNVEILIANIDQLKDSLKCNKFSNKRPNYYESESTYILKSF